MNSSNSQLAELVRFLFGPLFSDRKQPAKRKGREHEHAYTKREAYLYFYNLVVTRDGLKNGKFRFSKGYSLEIESDEFSRARSEIGDALNWSDRGVGLCLNEWKDHGVITFIRPVSATGRDLSIDGVPMAYRLDLFSNWSDDARPAMRKEMRKGSADAKANTQGEDRHESKYATSSGRNDKCESKCASGNDQKNECESKYETGSVTDRLGGENAESCVPGRVPGQARKNAISSTSYGNDDCGERTRSRKLLIWAHGPSRKAGEETRIAYPLSSYVVPAGKKFTRKQARKQVRAPVVGNPMDQEVPFDA